jgi:hypothetical protein
MPIPPKIISLDEIERLPGPGTLSWLPVRHTLGIRAFGCNAYTAARAGDDVVEPHTEDPTLAHEELYFVARGRASFTIDERQYNAPAGTYVFVPDPDSHRHAVATEPGTIVLSFGGPPVFEPSGWEWAFRARPLFEIDRGRARSILADGLAHRPESSTIHYSLAVLDALDGRREEALASLRTALELSPERRAQARGDPELRALHGAPEFDALVAPS